MATKPAVRPSLSRDRVLAAALTLVDQRGLEELTMRSLGEALSVEAMSIYRYCPSKADLLKGIADRVLAEIDFTERNRGWREDLGNALRSFWRVLVAHPNAVPLLLTTPMDTPGGRAASEVMLRLIGRAGLRPAEAHRVFRILQAFVLGAALMLRASPSGAAVRRQLAALEPAGEFPLLRSALADTVAIDREADFEFGLNSFLDAMEAGRSRPVSKRSGR